MGFSIGGMPSDMMKDYMDQMQTGKKDKSGKAFNRAMDRLGKKGGPEKPDKNKASWEKDEAAYEKSADKKEGSAKLYGNFTVKKNVEETDGTKLSERAQKLLDELKEKYGNMDFFVQDVSSDEEAEAVMSRGTKEYSVLVDPETLEKMAADAEFKDQCISSLEESTGQLQAMMEELGEDADKIESVGIKINTDGTTEFFAKLRESSDAQRQRIEDERAARRKEEKEKKTQEKEKEVDIDEEILETLKENFRMHRKLMPPTDMKKPEPGHGRGPKRHDIEAAHHMERPFGRMHMMQKPSAKGEVLKTDSMDALLEQLKSRGIGVKAAEEDKEEQQTDAVPEEVLTV